MTDSLSSLTALEKKIPSKNSMENKMNMLAEKGESLKLMWVPAHTEIEGNEAADVAAKDALNEDILPGTKATEMDWKRWLKKNSKKIFRK
jgi:ribonuclease HI